MCVIELNMTKRSAMGGKLTIKVSASLVNKVYSKLPFRETPFADEAVENRKEN